MVAFGLFKRIEVGPLHVLDKSDLEGLAIGDVGDHPVQRFVFPATGGDVKLLTAVAPSGPQKR